MKVVELLLSKGANLHDKPKKYAYSVIEILVLYLLLLLFFDLLFRRQTLRQ